MLVPVGNRPLIFKEPNVERDQREVNQLFNFGGLTLLSDKMRLERAKEETLTSPIKILTWNNDRGLFGSFKLPRGTLKRPEF